MAVKSIKTMFVRHTIESILVLSFVASIFVYNTASTFVRNSYTDRYNDILKIISSSLNNIFQTIEEKIIDEHILSYTPFILGYATYQDGIITDQENLTDEILAILEQDLDFTHRVGFSTPYYSKTYTGLFPNAKTKKSFFFLVSNFNNKNSYSISVMDNAMLTTEIETLISNLYSIEKIEIFDQRDFVVKNSIPSHIKPLQTQLRSGHTIRLYPSMAEIAEKLFLLKLSITVMLAFYLLFLFIKYSIISATIQKPIQRLVDLMDFAGREHFDLKLHDSSFKEMDLLSEQIDKMITRIKNMQEEIFKKNILSVKTQLKTLQTQINPHFMLNTLNTMKLMAVRGEKQQLTETIDDLSELLHYSVYEPMRLVSLSQEIKMVENYIEIMSRRFSKKIKFESFLPENLANKKTVKLIIQPIVENSIRHGFSNLQDGSIKISVTKKLYFITISITDNGKGMTKNQLEALQIKLDNPDMDYEKSIGLVNTNNRIKMEYGSEYEIEIESIEGEGTKVEIMIPDTI